MCPKSNLLLAFAYHGYVSFLIGYCSLLAEHDLHVTLHGFSNWASFYQRAAKPGGLAQPPALGLFKFICNVCSFAYDEDFPASRGSLRLHTAWLIYLMVYRNSLVTIMCFLSSSVICHQHHVCWKCKDWQACPKLQSHSCSGWTVQGHPAVRLQR